MSTRNGYAEKIDADTLQKNSEQKKAIALMVTTTAVIAIISMIVAIPFNTTMAQEEEQQRSQNISDTRQLRVTFDSIKINTDHDPLFSGEWLLDAYVNDQWVPLWIGTLSVDDGNVIKFSGSNSVVVNVTNNQTGELRIMTVGFEDDGLPEVLPILSTILNMNTTYPAYIFRAQDVVEDFVRFDANDPNGYVTRQFTAAENFGIGEHRDCSEPNRQATDPQNWWEGTCDFELFFRIEEVS